MSCLLLLLMASECKETIAECNVEKNPPENPLQGEKHPVHGVLEGSQQEEPLDPVQGLLSPTPLQDTPVMGQVKASHRQGRLNTEGNIAGPIGPRVSPAFPPKRLNSPRRLSVL